MRFLLLCVAFICVTSCGNEEQSLTPEEFINERNIKADLLENGVYIIIHNEGNELRATSEDVVEVSYEGRLTDDTVFDSKEEFKAILDDLLLGWQIGLQEIGEGGSCTLIIPYQMGFGSLENGPVPGKSTLVFDIDLKKIYPPLTIDEYIAEYNLNTTELEKGVHIVINESGDENKPTLDSQILATFTGRLTNTLIFDQGISIPFLMSNVIEGWQIGLQEIGVGGSCTLIVPAEVGYGSEAIGIIPANSPLVFEVELVDVQ